MSSWIHVFLPAKLVRSTFCYVKCSMFYAVRVGRNPGIYSTWDECKKQVNAFPQARYKKFSSQDLASEFLKETDNRSKEVSSNPQLQFSEETLTSAENCDLESTMSNSQIQDALNTVQLTSKTIQHQMELMSSTFGTLCEQITSVQSLLDKSGASGSREFSTAAYCPKKVLTPLKRSLTDGSSPSGDRVGSMGGSGVKKFKSTDSTSLEAAGWSGKQFSDLSAPVVYTDGSCYQNGRSGAQAGIGVYWGPENVNNVAERLAGRPTNNRAEIHAAVMAVKQAKKMGHSNLVICTDSEFMINSITKWIKGWKRKGWKLANGGPVINRDDFEELDAALKGMNVKWVHVRGHQGIPGNEAADQLANEGARKLLVD